MLNISALGSASGSSLSQFSSYSITTAKDKVRAAAGNLDAQSWLGPTSASVAAKISPAVAAALSELNSVTSAGLLTSGDLSGAASGAMARLKFNHHKSDPTFIPSSSGIARVEIASVALLLPSADTK